MTASGPHLSSEVMALLDQSKQILLAVGWTFLDLGLRNSVQSLADSFYHVLFHLKGFVYSFMKFLYQSSQGRNGHILEEHLAQQCEL